MLIKILQRNSPPICPNYGQVMNIIKLSIKHRKLEVLGSSFYQTEGEIKSQHENSTQENKGGPN